MTGLLKKRSWVAAVKRRCAHTMLGSALALCFTALFPGFAAAQGDGESLARFFGNYQGTGIAEGADDSLGISVRDLDVTIEPAKKKGFKVRWSALLRFGDKTDPKYRLKLAEVTFIPSGRPGVYEATSGIRPESGEWIGWARVSGNGMTVYQFLLDEDGGFQLTSHERTLTESGMALRFVRRQGSGIVRVVTGALEKVAN